MKSSSNLKRWALPIIGSVLATGAAAYLLKSEGLSFSGIQEALRKFSFATLFFALSASALQNFFMMVRLSALVSGTGEPVGKRRILQAIGIGQFVNSILPARAGDFGKILFLSQGELPGKISMATGTAVVLADKLVDLFSLLVLLLTTGALFLPQIREKFEGVPWWAVIPILLLGGWLLRKKLSKNVWEEFVKGLRGIVQWKSFSIALISALLVWVAEASAIRILIAGQGASASWDQAFFALCLLNVAIAVPVSVGNLGMFEGGLVVALRAIGIPTNEALAIAFSHHLLQIGAVLLWAVLALALKNVQRVENSR